MRVLITGSTGFIGANLALVLANNGIKVNALYRSAQKAKSLHHENINLCKGDILDPESLKKAVRGCEQVYHIAAFTDVWTKNPEDIYNLNVKGTLNVFDAALENNVKDIVFTSTAGVLGPSEGDAVNESTIRTTDYFLEYERTKAIAEDKVKLYLEKGLNIRIVNPTRVYGPGLLSKSNSVTIMIDSFNKGKWRIIPGDGKSTGNYVFIDDIVKGHILTMERGKPGERYILGGDNKNYLEFFNILQEITGRHHKMLKMPLPIMLSVSFLAMALNKMFGIKPFITPALVRKFNYNWEISSKKAVDELGYEITSLRDGIRETIKWLNEKKFVDRRRNIQDGK